MWIDYWWILLVLAYVVALAVVVVITSGRGTFEIVWPKITLAISCVVILLIPTMDAPGSYINAAIAVFNLLLMCRKAFRPEIFAKIGAEEGGDPPRHTRGRSRDAREELT